MLVHAAVWKLAVDAGGGNKLAALFAVAAGAVCAVGVGAEGVLAAGCAIAVFQREVCCAEDAVAVVRVC